MHRVILPQPLLIFAICHNIRLRRHLKFITGNIFHLTKVLIVLSLYCFIISLNSWFIFLCKYVWLGFKFMFGFLHLKFILTANFLSFDLYYYFLFYYSLFYKVYCLRIYLFVNLFNFLSNHFIEGHSLVIQKILLFLHSSQSISTHIILWKIRTGYQHKNIFVEETPYKVHSFQLWSRSIQVVNLSKVCFKKLFSLEVINP